MTWQGSYVVVPEGLACDAAGRLLPEPSFAYRSALDWVAARARRGERIFLAPANCFDGPVSEQEAGAAYLRDRHPDAEIIAFESSDARYIDTRGNAVLLREYLQRTRVWPLTTAVLVAYYLHLPRARLIFRQEGFRFDRTIGVGHGARNDERIVSRLWYYRYRIVHACYELLAYPAYLLGLR